MVVIFTLKSEAAPRDLVDFTVLANNFFSTYVNDGRVDYRTIRSNPALLDDLVGVIKQTNLAALTGNERKAFLINTYNILVIKQIVDNLDKIETTVGLTGFFDQITFMVGGVPMTLNKLEIKYLLMEFRDARIHFALACGAIGCPKLQGFAYQEEDLDAKLDAVTRTTLNDPNFIRVSESSVQVSQIFKWYSRDFLTEAPSILDYINQYRDNPIPTDKVLSYYDYDWNLNIE
jgi:hypothetical protein